MSSDPGTCAVATLSTITTDTVRCHTLPQEHGQRFSCWGLRRLTLVFQTDVNKAVSIVFVSLFGISTLMHLVQAVRSKKWYLLWTIWLCAVGETIGWAGRLWSSISTEWLSAFGGHW